MAEVTISLDRYEELLDCETRVHVLVELMKRGYPSREEVYSILGYENDAEREKRKSEESRFLGTQASCLLNTALEDSENEE